MRHPSVYRLPTALTPSTELGAIEMPTRLRTVLVNRLGVRTAAELGALPAERMAHVGGLGQATRPVLTRLVLAVRRALGPDGLAPRLAGDAHIRARPLNEVAGAMPRPERMALDAVGVATLDALGAMPRALLARMPGIGPDALGRLAAMCIGENRLTSLSGLLAALDPARAEALELVYGLRDGLLRSTRETALILGRTEERIKAAIDPQHLKPLPPMRVLAATVREAIAPVGFAVLPVVAGRLAARLPTPPEERINPAAFARLGALLIRPEADVAALSAIRIVAETRWTSQLIRQLTTALQDADASGEHEADIEATLVGICIDAGMLPPPGDALMVAVAGLCPGVVLSISPMPIAAPLTDPEIVAMVGVDGESRPEQSASEPLVPSRQRSTAPPIAIPDSTDAVRDAVGDVARRNPIARAEPMAALPISAVKAALETGGPAGLLVPRSHDALDRLAAALRVATAADSIRIIEAGKAITAGLAVMIDAPIISPEKRARRLADALDAAVDLGGRARPGTVTIVGDLSLALTLGMAPWIRSLAERARSTACGLILFAAPGDIDDRGLRIDRLHLLPGLTRAEVLHAP